MICSTVFLIRSTVVWSTELRNPNQTDASHQDTFTGVMVEGSEDGRWKKKAFIVIVLKSNEKGGMLHCSRWHRK